jgi:TldD protein
MNRRNFLKNTSSAIGVLASSQFLLTDRIRAQTPEALIKAKPFDKVQLHALALKALDVAKAAGAKFADVRILVGHQLTLGVTSEGMGSPGLETIVGIGVRAVADSTIGFAGGILELNAEKVTSLAQIAVERSKRGQSRKARAFEFAPAPAVAAGSWQTPIEIDPFTIPLGEQEALLLDAIEGVKNRAGHSGMTVAWIRRDEIFASTEGSYIEQRTYTASLQAGTYVRSRHDEFFGMYQGVKTLREGGYGYEALSKANLKAEWPRVAEEALRLDTLPLKSVDVGRYDVVLSAGATAELLALTIADPLKLERALLLATNTGGTTYAMPPSNILGKFQLGSKLLSITADRSTPHANATVGWDAEGVAPEDFTLVRDGVVVDYLTTRETAPALRAWYESENRSVRSNACATGSGAQMPRLNCPNLTLRPGPGPTSVDDLIKDVKRGYFVDRFVQKSIDQAGLNVQVSGSPIQEIVNGRRAGVIKDMALQFATPQFWKSVDAIGGPASAVMEHVIADGPGGAESPGLVGVSVVPVRARKVNVVNTGKTS